MTEKVQPRQSTNADQESNHQTQIRPRGWALHLMPQSLKGVFFLLLMIAIVPVVFGQAFIFYNWYQMELEEQVEHNLEIARGVSRSFESYVRDILHQELAVGLELSSHPWSAEAANKLFAESAKEYPSILHYSWVSPSGQLLYTSTRERLGLNVADRPHIGEILRGKEWAISDLMPDKVNGDPIFAVSRGIRDERGNLLGIVGAVIDPKKLDHALKVEREGDGAILIMDTQGRLVYRYPQKEYSWEERERLTRNPSIGRVLAGEEVTDMEVSTSSNVVRMAGRAPIPFIGWAAAASRPVEEATAPAFRRLALNIGLFLLMLVSFITVAFIIGLHLTAPMKRLREHTLALGRGDFDRRIEVRGPSEFAELANAFNRMAEEIRLRQEETTRSYAAEQAERHLLQTMVNQMPEGVFFAEAPDGRIIMANQAACRLFGREIPPGTTIDRKAAEYGLFRPDGQPYSPIDLPISRALQGETVTQQEMIVQRSDGSSITLLFNCVPVIVNDRIEKAIAVFQDVSPLKEAESLRAELIQLISHDLRAPLTVIQGRAQLLQRTRGGNGQLDLEKQSIEAIVTSGQRMNAMIQDLVDSTRLETGQVYLEKRPVDLRIALIDLLERMNLPANAGRVKEEIPPELPPVNADPDRLERILTNLISNALKYSPRDAEVIIRAERNRNEVVTSVIDRGIGIPTEDIPQLFQRFYRTGVSGNTEGLGLGLYITKMLVESHGGRIWVDSEPGKGSTFYFTLPAV